MTCKRSFNNKHRTTNSASCTYCGEYNHRESEWWLHVCNGCNSRGHYLEVCPDSFLEYFDQVQCRVFRHRASQNLKRLHKILRELGRLIADANEGKAWHEQHPHCPRAVEDLAWVSMVAADLQAQIQSEIECLTREEDGESKFCDQGADPKPENIAARYQRASEDVQDYQLPLDYVTTVNNGEWHHDQEQQALLAVENDRDEDLDELEGNKGNALEEGRNLWYQCSPKWILEAMHDFAKMFPAASFVPPTYRHPFNKEGLGFELVQNVDIACFGLELGNKARVRKIGDGALAEVVVNDPEEGYLARYEAISSAEEPIPPPEWDNVEHTCDNEERHISCEKQQSLCRERLLKDVFVDQEEKCVSIIDVLNMGCTKVEKVEEDVSSEAVYFNTMQEEAEDSQKEWRRWVGLPVWDPEPEGGEDLPDSKEDLLDSRELLDVQLKEKKPLNLQREEHEELLKLQLIENDGLDSRELRVLQLDEGGQDDQKMGGLDSQEVQNLQQREDVNEQQRAADADQQQRAAGATTTEIAAGIAAGIVVAKAEPMVGDERTDLVQRMVGAGGSIGATGAADVAGAANTARAADAAGEELRMQRIAGADQRVQRIARATDATETGNRNSMAEFVTAGRRTSATEGEPVVCDLRDTQMSGQGDYMLDAAWMSGVIPVFGQSMDSAWFDGLLEDDRVPIQDDILGEVDAAWFDTLLEDDLDLHVEQVVQVVDLGSSLMDDSTIHDFFMHMLRSYFSWYYGDGISSCLSSIRGRGGVFVRAHVAVAGASSTYFSYWHGRAYDVYTPCRWSGDLLITSWFYIFILYDHEWMILYYMGSQPWHVAIKWWHCIIYTHMILCTIG